MKVTIKLSVKFFLAFLLGFVVLIALMLVAIQFYAQRSFRQYVQSVEAERMNEVAGSLAREYASNRGWEQLRNNGPLWSSILRPLGSPPDSRALTRLPSRFAPLRRRSHGVEELAREQPYGQGPRPQEEQNRISFGIAPRLTLFATDGKPVVGPGSSVKNHTLREIRVDGKTVGWLGLLKEERLSQPLDLAFVREQLYAFYIIGALMIVLASGIAFFLSRHLLRPIRQLAAGTRAVASLKFDTTIDVKSGDELGQLASDFNFMSDTLQRYEQMRKQWISEIAHELRTPLSILQGEIEALQDGVRPFDDRVLESLYADVLHLTLIVSDLHELSLSDIGAFRINKERVDPLQILRETLDLFRNRLGKERIDLHTNLDADRTLLLAADPARLTQLFTNLLENAIRYVNKPGVLKIGYRLAERELELCFEDSGPGVPEEALQFLFERFYRVNPKTQARGSGLGLAICRAIVEAHNGTIAARRAPSGGLAIHVVLPLQP